MRTHSVEFLVAETAIDNFAARRLAEAAGQRLLILCKKHVWRSG
jgi:hypothetical protein